MKSLLLFVLMLSSLSALAAFEYSCNLFPDEQGGNTLLIRISGNKAKVYSITYSEQERPATYVTTLHKISTGNSLIKHYLENKDGNGMEFFIRREAGTLGRIDHRTHKFRLYACSYGEVHQHR